MASFVEYFKKYQNYFIAGILLIVVLIFILINQFFSPQADTNKETPVNREYILSHPISSSDAANLSKFRPLGRVTFDKERRILIDGQRRKELNVGVSYRKNEPLLTEVANQSEVEPILPIPDVIPWYYFSPNVAKISPFSMANEYQLIKSETINEFAWYSKEGETYLFHQGKLFTGWHNMPLDGWYYYQDGRLTDHRISQADTQKYNLQARIIRDLAPTGDLKSIYIEQENDYAFNATIRPVSYSILYKNDQSMILTSPPETKGSALLTTTENFYDMPMEVVEEMTSAGEQWLHVYIGYENLGWIRKDLTHTDYVPTYYSERVMLDRVEQVLEEEISMIGAQVGASFVNNETMSQISYNNQIFFPASTQKIYVLGELYHQYKTGQLSPDTYVTLTDYDKVPGAGIIQGYPDGSQFSLDELVDLVSIYSDNTAANLIIDTVGGGPVINPHIHQMGLYDTYIEGKYYGGASTWFTTSPADAARFFALLANNQVNGQPWDEMLIGKFTMNTHTFLRQLTPWDMPSWNKSGLGNTEQNDVATFITPYGEYSIAVYTADPIDYDGIGEQVAYLSVRVMDVFNEERQKLWTTVEE